jgi:hypothetical protein
LNLPFNISFNLLLSADWYDKLPVYVVLPWKKVEKKKMEEKEEENKTPDVCTPVPVSFLPPSPSPPSPVVEPKVIKMVYLIVINTDSFI